MIRPNRFFKHALYTINYGILWLQYKNATFLMSIIKKTQNEIEIFPLWSFCIPCKVAKRWFGKPQWYRADANCAPVCVMATDANFVNWWIIQLRECGLCAHSRGVKVGGRRNWFRKQFGRQIRPPFSPVTPHQSESAGRTLPGRFKSN